MYRLIAAVSILIFCVFAGKYFSNKKSKKAAFYLSLCDFSGDYIKEMNFSRRPIKELLSKTYASQNFNELLKVLNEKAFNENFIDLKGALCGDWQNGLNLSSGELSEIETFFSLLGTSDASSQAIECSRYLKHFETTFLESEKSDKTLGALYGKLGIIIGLIAFVIVI